MPAPPRVKFTSGATPRFFVAPDALSYGAVERQIEENFNLYEGPCHRAELHPRKIVASQASGKLPILNLLGGGPCRRGR